METKTITVSKTFLKSGTKKDGNRWRRYAIQDEEGEFYQSFDPHVFQGVKFADIGRGDILKVRFEATERDGYTNNNLDAVALANVDFGDGDEPEEQPKPKSKPATAKTAPPPGKLTFQQYLGVGAKYALTLQTALFGAEKVHTQTLYETAVRFAVLLVGRPELIDAQMLKPTPKTKPKATELDDEDFDVKSDDIPGFDGATDDDIPF